MSHEPYRVTVARGDTRHELPNPASSSRDAIDNAEQAIELLNDRPGDPWRIEIRRDGQTEYLEYPLVLGGQGRSAAQATAYGMFATICFFGLLFFFVLAVVV